MTLIRETAGLLIGDGLSFLSFGYLVFLAAAVLIRYLFPEKACIPALLVISWLFYCTWNPACLLYIILSTISTYVAGLYVGRKDELQKGIIHRNAALAVCLVFNFGLLFYCKYWGMFFPDVFGDRLIPVGISFYTLQASGYVIDCYRYGKRISNIDEEKEEEKGKDKEKDHNKEPHSHSHHISALDGFAPEHNFIRYALFVSFFPGILSGPIERAQNMLPQYRKPCRFSYENLRNGITIMIWGYFLKLVIADRIAIVTDNVYASPENWKGTLLVLAILLYPIQIYCDFAGYSAIACGSARILGFRFKNNFDAPYLSGSIAEYWRRWHISLSSWFRDYLYIPLGGNRKGKARKYLNILIVFSASGLWHGAAFSYIGWGLLHGLYQVVGYVLKPVRDAIVNLLHIDRSSFSHRLLKVLVTYGLISFAFIFFRSESVDEAMRIISCIPGFQPWNLFNGTLLNLGLDAMNWVLLIVSMVFLLARDICVKKGISLRVKIQQQGRWFRWTLYIVALLLILVCGVWGPDYDASTFIYSQF